MKDLGMMLLAAWLIALGIVVGFDVRFDGSAELIAIVGIAAGVVLIYDNRGRFASNVGTLLLSLWLILNGISLFAQSSIFDNLAPLLLLLGLAAGVFLIVEAAARGAANNLGPMFLGIFLLVSRMLPLLQVTTPFLYTLTFAFAIVAGILLILRR